MRPLAVLVLAGFLIAFGVAAVPSPARAMAPAIFQPAPAWMIGLTTTCVVRILELVDGAVEDLRDRVDRRRWDPPPPLFAPSLEAVDSGGTTTAPGDAVASGGMIP